MKRQVIFMDFGKGLNHVESIGLDGKVYVNTNFIGGETIIIGNKSE